MSKDFPSAVVVEERSVNLTNDRHAVPQPVKLIWALVPVAKVWVLIDQQLEART